jgi:hypothetical protein
MHSCLWPLKRSCSIDAGRLASTCFPRAGGDVSVSGTKKFVKSEYEQKKAIDAQTGDFVN